MNWELADLKGNELDRVRRLEQELGVVLVAYKGDRRTMNGHSPVGDLAANRQPERLEGIRIDRPDTPVQEDDPSFH